MQDLIVWFKTVPLWDHPTSWANFINKSYADYREVESTQTWGEYLQLQMIQWNIVKIDNDIFFKNPEDMSWFFLHWS